MHDAPVTQTPLGRDTPDAGTPFSARLAAIGAFVFVGLVMLLQQLPHVFPGAPEPPEAGVTAPEQGDEFTMQAVMLVKLANVVRDGSGKVQDGERLMNLAETPGQTLVERVRTAVVAGEVVGAEEALRRLDAVGTEIAAADAQSEDAPPAGLDADIATLRRIYGGETVDDAEREELIARHGYFAKLALVHDAPRTDPTRERLTGGGIPLVLTLTAVMVVVTGAFIAAVVLFIVGVIRFSSGRIRPRFTPPLPGGSVFLETVAVMAIAFLALQAVKLAIATAFVKEGERAPEWLIVFSLATQWLLVAVPFYPLLRGVPWPELKRRIGWTRGEGVFREIGAGLGAYFATLPFLFVAIGVSLFILFVRALVDGGNGGPAAPDNPVAELLGSGGPLLLILVFLLATVWAPFVEESVFRGALYRHLRSWWGVAPSAVVTAIAFGVMHGYPFFLLLPVIVLGFNFSLMREWRGSLIGPMVTHGLHNATLLAIVGPLMWQMRIPG